jgi:hypothetical protein
MPARVGLFSAASEGAPSSRAARTVPAVTSSQRQRMVVSGIVAGSEGGAVKSRHRGIGDDGHGGKCRAQPCHHIRALDGGHTSHGEAGFVIAGALSPFARTNAGAVAQRMAAGRREPTVTHWRGRDAPA